MRGEVDLSVYVHKKTQYTVNLFPDDSVWLGRGAYLLVTIMSERKFDAPLLLSVFWCCLITLDLFWKKDLN